MVFGENVWCDLRAIAGGTFILRRDEMKCEAVVNLKIKMLLPGQANSVGANATIYDFLSTLSYDTGLGEYHGPGENVEILQMEVCSAEMSPAEGQE